MLERVALQQERAPDTIVTLDVLGGGNSNTFNFHPEPWGNDDIFLQMSWFNHQLVLFSGCEGVFLMSYI